MRKTGKNGRAPPKLYPGGTAGAILYQIDSGITGATAAGSTDQLLSSSGTQRPVWKPVTGSGSGVLQTSPTLITPTLITPNIGSASASAISISTLTPSRVVGSDSNKNLVSLANTGTGDVVLANSPNLITPNIGTAAATSINISSLNPYKPVGTDGSNNLVSFSSTGSGTTVAMQVSPSFTTPNLGEATGTQLTVTGIPGQPSEYNTLVCKTITDNAGCGIQLLNASGGTPGAYNILLTQSAFEQNGLALSGAKNIFFGAGNASAANSVQIKRNTSTPGGACKLYIPGLDANKILTLDSFGNVTATQAAATMAQNVVTLTGTGVYNCPAGVKSFTIEMIGGGGGGAGLAEIETESVPAMAGSGGGSGAYAKIHCSADVLGFSYTVGSRGLGGTYIPNVYSTPGGDSVVTFSSLGTYSGAYIRASGGGAGINLSQLPDPSIPYNAQIMPGGAGGVVTASGLMTNKYMVVAGAQGGWADTKIDFIQYGGAGAASFYGGGAPQVIVHLYVAYPDRIRNQNGRTTNTLGAGGGGFAGDGYYYLYGKGGDGGPGAIFVTEYY